jgi:very-short-patch-repair endonuclease
VGAVLDAVEAAVVGLFPAWLPEAEGITGIGGSSEPAVRALALRVGSTTEHHGPYLAELASRSLRQDERLSTDFPGRGSGPRRGPRVRRHYGRTSTALIVELPELRPAEELGLVDGANFLVRYGRLAVWLAGPALRSVDSVPDVRVEIPSNPLGSDQHNLPPVWYAPVVGRPHPASVAEQALESALAAAVWASGRAWNQTYESHALATPIRLDLAWIEEQLVVEIDGPEHRDARRFEADRRRDVLLALEGFTVVRFTNECVADDVARVVSQLERLVQNRRQRPSGGLPS